MNSRYYVVRLSAGSTEQRIGHAGLTSEEAEGKRDRLNEDLAWHGVPYAAQRYAIRAASEFAEKAVAA